MSDSTPPPVSPVLAFRSVSHSYGSRAALDDISLDVPAGRVTLLLGPNGAGKTTLFSLACRLLALQLGDIMLDQISIAESGPQTLRSMGIVFQQPTLDLDLTVRQNLRYFGALHGLSRLEADERLATELDRIGMAGRADETVRVLNGGHRRRVEIARALLTEPRLLLLDEPTVGLDQPTRRSLVSYFHQLARDRGLALLWATHLLDEAEVGDEVIVLSGGRIRATGRLADVIDQAGAANLEEAFAILTAPHAEGRP